MRTKSEVCIGEMTKDGEIDWTEDAITVENSDVEDMVQVNGLLVDGHEMILAIESALRVQDL